MKMMRTKLLNKELELGQITAESRKQAAVVLEVLAGVRSPDQACQALGVSLPTYYNLETRALRGLIWSCTPEPPGHRMFLAHKLRVAEQRSAELEKQVQRYQALLRTAQRSIGLVPAEPPKASSQAKHRRRKPAVRAMRAIEAIRQAEQSPSASATQVVAASVSSSEPAEAVRRAG
jgi:hypothetical protein